MDNAFLVNVVHNDFKDADAIFKPFIAAGESYKNKQSTTSEVKVNGIH